MVNGLPLWPLFEFYNSWAESVEAHAKLLTYGVDWNPKLYEPVLKAKKL